MKAYDLAAWGVLAALTSGSAAADQAEAAAKQFTIPPEDGDRSFMCERGYLQSVLASAAGEHRLAPIRLLDPSGAPIPDGTWGRPAGFRLDHKANVIVRVIMICAP
jgi:hypothetical protein